MKLTVFFLSACFLHVSASGISQKVSFSGKDVPIEKIFSVIEKQTGFVFLYNEPVLTNTQPVTVDAHNVPIDVFLSQILAGQSLDFTIRSKSIFISPRTGAGQKPSGHYPVDFPAQLLSPIDVHGRIVNELGEPVMASITVKGTHTGTTSNADGIFVLKHVEDHAILVISSIATEPQEINVGGLRELNITLHTRINTEQEVIIKAGYYDVKRSELTGSIGRVDAKTIEQQPVTNLLESLQGRVPGLLITSSSGLPGSDISIQIRGLNSVAAGTAPLYIIDGVIIPSSTLSSINGDNGLINPLNTLNPSDIESIEVLKDADATAIYGSRGANGVLLITTKKAKGGKTTFDLDVYRGTGRVARTIDFLNTREYLQLRRKAFAADGIIPDATNAPDLLVWDTSAYTNWQKLLIGNLAPVTNVQATVAGGEQRTHFLLSAGYRDQGTVLPGDGSDKRLNTHLNVEHASENNRFHLNTNLIYGKDLIRSLSTDPFRYLLTPPNMPQYDSAGNPYALGGGLGLRNPLAFLYTRANTTTDQFIGNAELRYSLPANLELKVSAGYTNMQQRQIVTHPEKSLDPYTSLGYRNYSEFGDSYSNSFLLEPQINYNGHVGAGKLQALLGSSIQNNNSGSSYLFATDYASDALLESLGAATNILTRNSTTSQYRYISGFGRLNYNWKGRYIVNATGRRDGSSRFGPGKRIGTFWSLGAAWLFYQEKNVGNLLPWLNFGKLRGSYGSTGNDQIGNYQYLQTYTSTFFPYQNAAGLYPNRLANENYSWETNKKTEAALELGMLKSRINLSIAWFLNRSGNQLVSYPLPSQTGFISYQANLPALVQNRGWEFELQTTNIRSAHFNWTTSFNLTAARNKLLKFPGLASSSYADRLAIGQPLNLLKLYHFIGVDPQTGVPLVEDVDHDGQVGFGKDMVNAGTRDPKFYGGIGNHFGYRNFSLDIFFQFQKAIGYGYVYAFDQPPGFLSNVSSAFASGAWAKPGDQSSRPALTSTAASETYFAYTNYYNRSDAALSDASYVRLKNVSFSYSLPSAITGRMKISGLRIFLQGQNLLTFTHYNGVDPETQTATPVLKIVTAGIHFTL